MKICTDICPWALFVPSGRSSLGRIEDFRERSLRYGPPQRRPLLGGLEGILPWKNWGPRKLDFLLSEDKSMCYDMSFFWLLKKFIWLATFFVSASHKDSVLLLMPSQFFILRKRFYLGKQSEFNIFQYICIKNRWSVHSSSLNPHCP